MKNVLTKIIALVLVVVSCLALTACGDSHKHDFSKKDVATDYLASAATCTAAAKYYYSCECGEKGSDTFEMGSPAHDYIDHVCKNCQAKEVYTEGLKFTIIKSTGEATLLGFQEGATIPERIIVPTKYQNVPVTSVGKNAFKGVKGFMQIQLPEGIKNIFEGAFAESSLTSITIPTTVVQIQPLAFVDSSVATITFLVTEGWFSGRHVMSSPDEDAAVSPLTMAKASTMASTLSRDDRQSNGGNNFYYRIAK